MTISNLTLAVNDVARSYSAYASLEEAEIFLGADIELCETWLNLGEANQVKRLVSATRRLDRLTWAGRPAVIGQILAWPRVGLSFPDGAPVGSTVLPAAVEEAAIVLAGDTSVDLAASVGGRSEIVQSQQVGRKREAYFYQLLTELEMLLPGGTLALLQHWLTFRRRYVGASVTSQDKDAPSEFSETYERTVYVGTNERIR